MSDAADPPRAALDGYWNQSRLPLTSLAFVAPLLVLYEVGVLLLGPGAPRNAVDVWLRHSLAVLGFGQYLLLPVLCAAVLLGWHFTTRQSWRIGWWVLPAMAVESAVLAVILWQGARLGGGLWEWVAGRLPPAAHPAGARGLLGEVVGFVGAGIYEELLFRLILLSGAAGLAMAAGLSRRTGFALAIVLTSLLFAAAHHLPGGDPFGVSLFLFRFAAGAFFAVIFALRGFGIAVGAHAGYDVLVGIVVPRLM